MLLFIDFLKNIQLYQINSRMSKWPEDCLIYDSDDDSIDYALTNYTIHEIKMSIKRRL
jgi:hypothetical protein